MTVSCDGTTITYWPRFPAVDDAQHVFEQHVGPGGVEALARLVVGLSLHAGAQVEDAARQEGHRDAVHDQLREAEGRRSVQEVAGPEGIVVVVVLCAPVTLDRRHFSRRVNNLHFIIIYIDGRHEECPI